MSASIDEKILLDRHHPIMIRRRHWRNVKDRVTRYFMAFGGVSVIIAILLIFFYLLHVVIPLFRPATIEPVATYPVAGVSKASTLFLATEEYAEIGLRITGSADAVFFNLANGKKISREALPIGALEITALASGDPSQRSIALGLSDGSARVLQHDYKVSFPNDVRAITPSLKWPLGQSIDDGPVIVDEARNPLIRLAVQSHEEQTTLVAVTSAGSVILANCVLQESFLGESASLEISRTILPINGKDITHLVLNVDQTTLYIATRDGQLRFYDVTHKDEPKLIDQVNAVAAGTEITALRFLAGGLSLLVGDSEGRISQWFPVRDDSNTTTLAKVREFHAQHSPIIDIAPEYFRKGFAAVDATGDLGLYHTTAHRTLLVEHMSDKPITHLAMAPRANGLIVLDVDGGYQFYSVRNEHPEISWKALWGKVWYESRQAPEYIWQSSSASSDFEPKFSLTPLAFGTVKAAFYAMLFAVPLAIMGAIFTGYFMAPGMRRLVKPTIEVMEALPTVILGFLAGLWLAPLVENNLPGIFAILIMTPLLVLICAYGGSRLPASLRHRIPDGWEAALLIPVVCIAMYLAMTLSQPVEELLFAGSLPNWLNDQLGIHYDQRNSLVVGLAMGFAVIPTIFSISEDAIFSVPKHLTVGSLALGATRWQTLISVVLLTASPGIFSGIMIGLGRAVGETMIVLMATGNTPIMDMNIFQGFRALSANIAVEMPEAEVASTHYRVLFLAAFVLFLVTFVFNTAAEIVRQRLRAKYSTL